MNQFRFGNNINPSKIFFINRSQIEGRFDPNAYHPDRLSAIKKLEQSGNELKKLRIVADFRKQQVSEIPNEETIYVGLENVQSNTGAYIPTDEKESVSSASVFKQGDILFPKLRPYLNKIFLAEFDGICSTEFHVISSSTVNKAFLAYFLRSELVVKQTSRLMSGNTLPRVQTEDIYNLLIPVPSQEKQQAIVSLMQEANKQKAQKEAEAKKLLNSIDDYLLPELGIKLPEKDNSLENRIFETFFSKGTGQRFDPLFFYENFLDELPKGNFKTDNLSNFIKSIENGFAAGSKIQSSKKDGILQLRPTNINSNREFIFEKNIFVKSELLKSRKEDLCQKGEILFNNTNSQELVGKSVFFDLDIKAFCSNHITRIQTEDNLNPQYLVHILNLFQRQKVFFQLCTNWNNQSGVNIDVLKSLPIPIPSPKKQNKIADHINELRNKANQLKKEAQQEIENARRQVEEMILAD